MRPSERVCSGERRTDECAILYRRITIKGGQDKGCETREEDIFCATFVISLLFCFSLLHFSVCLCISLYSLLAKGGGEL